MKYLHINYIEQMIEKQFIRSVEENDKENLDVQDYLEKDVNGYFIRINKHPVFRVGKKTLWLNDEQVEKLFKLEEDKNK